MDPLSPEGLLQLAQYQPYRDGGESREQTFRQMVGPILMENGGRVENASQLQESFRTLFGIEVDKVELNGWLSRLEEVGAIERDASAILVTKRARQLLERARDDFEALSYAAKKEWRASLISLDPTLTDGEIGDLEADLDKLIALIVAYHGAEAAVILFPEQERSGALRETLRSKTESLPRRSAKLDGVRKDGLSQFFYEPTQNQRRYLADRLDHGFFATVGTLRPEGAAAVREELAGQRLYLDTNVLIGAFGLAGREINESIKRLLDLSRGLGVKFAVTSQTVEEFRHSLDRAKEQILSRGLPSRRYAGVLRNAARDIGGVSLVEGYYESYGEHGSTPDDWFRRASQFEPIFDELGISIEDEGMASALKTEGQRVNDYVVLLNREAAFRSGRPRDDLPMQHDAIHRVLIERLRGQGNRRFGTAQYWFLTEDKILPRFGQLALEGESPPNVPFCISGAAWRQIARCFTPRTEDFDQTITDLLASPYLRFGKTRDLGEIQRAVARISTLIGDEGSPAVVAAAVSDETLEAAAGAEGSDAEDEVFREAYERSEDELAQRMSALQDRVEAMDGELKAEQEHHTRSTAEIIESKKEKAVLKAQVAEREQELEESREALNRERSLGAQEIERLKSEKAAAKVSAENRRSRRLRTLTMASALVVLVIAALLLIFNWISPVAAILGGGMVVALLLAPFIENSRWAWRAVFLLGVLAVIVAVIPLLE